MIVRSYKETNTYCLVTVKWSQTDKEVSVHKSNLFLRRFLWNKDFVFNKEFKMLNHDRTIFYLYVRKSDYKKDVDKKRKSSYSNNRYINQGWF